MCLEREVRDRTLPRHSPGLPAGWCSVSVDEGGLIGCVHTHSVCRHPGGALGREVAPPADRGPVHASEVGGLLAVDSETFGDEHTRDHTVIVAQSAATAHQSGQLKVGVGDLCGR